MKTRKFKLPRPVTLLDMAALFLVASLFVSCKKHVSQATYSKGNIDEIAKILNGKNVSGPLKGSSNENELVLNYNNGNQFILIEKLPGSQNMHINSTKFGEVITSNYGVVVKYVTNNTVLLLVNNDEESIKKFELIKSLLKENFESYIVFGTTIVNSEEL
jgi:hypothetical protein